MKILTKTGKQVWVRTTGEAVRDESGKIIAVCGSFQDISKLKQTEELLKESEEKFRKYFFSLPGIVGISTFSEGRYVEVNENLIEWFGSKREEIIGKTSKELGVFFDYSSRAELIKLLSDEGRIRNYEVKVVIKSGEIRDCLFSAELVEVNGEKCILAFINDVTERKQMEYELQKARDYAENLIKTANTIVVGLDKNGLIKIFNEAAEKITGYTMEELKSKNWFEVLVPRDRYPEVWDMFKMITKERILKNFENPILTKSGEERFVVWQNNEVIENGEPIGTISFGLDITERKKIEDALKESEARLKELNATKDKFFNIIAHDLKNPFNNILGFSELLVEQMKEKDYSDIEKYAEAINRASCRAMDLLTNLLDWSRSQTGRIEFNPEYNDMVLIINDVIELTGDLARSKSISINLKSEEKIPFIGDRSMISTVIRNLLSNAIKFSFKGGNIEITAAENEKEVIVSVSDNGTGISKENTEKLFKIGDLVSTQGTNNEKGTGLGLILCKEFIDKHGGKIRAESEIGKGSRFIFSIPVVRFS